MPGSKIDLPSDLAASLFMSCSECQAWAQRQWGSPGLRKDGRGWWPSPSSTATRCIYSILVPSGVAEPAQCHRSEGKPRPTWRLWGEPIVANSRGSRLKLVWWGPDWVLIWWVTLDKSQSISGPISLAVPMEIISLPPTPLAIRRSGGYFRAKRCWIFPITAGVVITATND